MSEYPKVEVKIHSANEGAWYANKLNEIFEVYDRGTDFVVAVDYDKGHWNGWRHIEKNDCFLHPTPSTLSPEIGDKRLSWVKSGERSPKKDELYHCEVEIDRWGNGSEIMYTKDTVRFAIGRWFTEFSNWKVLFWLEEIDIPASQPTQTPATGERFQPLEGELLSVLNKTTDRLFQREAATGEVPADVIEGMQVIKELLNAFSHIGGVGYEAKRMATNKAKLYIKKHEGETA